MSNYNGTNNKSIWQAILSLLLGIVVGAAAIFGIGYGMKWISFDNDVDEVGGAEAAGNVVIGEVKGNGISLTSSLYDTGDIDSTNKSTESYTITATYSPSNATYQDVTMSVAWVNSASTWASGKTVTDYVTITQTSTGSLTGTLTCLQAFGEQVKLTVTSDRDSSLTAEATVDYVARVTGVNSTNKLYGSTTKLTNSNITMINFGESLCVEQTLTLSNYTVSGTFSGNIYLDFHTQEMISGSNYSTDYPYSVAWLPGYTTNFIGDYINTSATQPGLYSLGSFTGTKANVISSALFANGFSDLIPEMFTLISGITSTANYSTAIDDLTASYISDFGTLASAYDFTRLPPISVIIDYTHTYNGTVYSSGQACIGYITFSTSGLEVVGTGVALSSGSSYVF